MIEGAITWEETIAALTDDGWRTWRDREAAAFVAYDRFRSGRLPPFELASESPRQSLQRLGYIAEMAVLYDAAPNRVGDWADGVYRSLGRDEMLLIPAVPGDPPRGLPDVLALRWRISRTSIGPDWLSSFRQSSTKPKQMGLHHKHER